MSWRRFETLLRGLGPNSATAARAYARAHSTIGAGAVRIVDGGPDEATRVFSALFGGEAKH